MAYVKYNALVMFPRKCYYQITRVFNTEMVAYWKGCPCTAQYVPGYALGNFYINDHINAERREG